MLAASFVYRYWNGLLKNSLNVPIVRHSRYEAMYETHEQRGAACGVIEPPFTALHTCNYYIYYLAC